MKKELKNIFSISNMSFGENGQFINTDSTFEDAYFYKEIGKIDFSDFGNKIEKNNYGHIRIVDINKYEYFGDICIYFGKPAPLSLKVKSRYAELFLLRKKDMLLISKIYPNIWKRIYNKSYFNLLAIKKITFNELIKYYMKDEMSIHTTIIETKKTILKNKQIYFQKKPTIKNNKKCKLKQKKNFKKGNEEKNEKLKINDQSKKPKSSLKTRKNLNNNNINILVINRNKSQRKKKVKFNEPIKIEKLKESLDNLSYSIINAFKFLKNNEKLKNLKNILSSAINEIKSLNKNSNNKSNENIIKCKNFKSQKNLNNKILIDNVELIPVSAESFCIKSNYSNINNLTAGKLIKNKNFQLELFSKITELSKTFGIQNDSRKNIIKNKIYKKAKIYSFSPIKAKSKILPLTILSSQNDDNSNLSINKKNNVINILNIHPINERKIQRINDKISKYKTSLIDFFIGRKSNTKKQKLQNPNIDIRNIENLNKDNLFEYNNINKINNNENYDLREIVIKKKNAHEKENKKKNFLVDNKIEKKKDENFSSEKCFGNEIIYKRSKTKK